MIYETGADPINVQAAKMLWQSPWWAKFVESEVSFKPVETSQDTYEGALVRLRRDFRKTMKRREEPNELYALAQMAKHIRWDTPKVVNTSRQARELIKIRLKLAMFENGYIPKHLRQRYRIEVLKVDGKTRIRLQAI
jgi:hypothetical protein